VSPRARETVVRIGSGAVYLGDLGIPQANITVVVAVCQEVSHALVPAERTVLGETTCSSHVSRQSATSQV
jgi:hypothetical protein